MRKFTVLLAPFLTLTFVSCSDQSKPVIDKLQNDVDSLRVVVNKQSELIARQHDTIVTLQYPADQRLAAIKRLVSEENYDEAKKEIASLQKVFPNSPEARECPTLTESINAKLAAIEAEKERIKALGFKALKQQSTVTIGYNKVVISGISIGKEFVHDTYGTYTGSSWYYNTADRGNKFITAAMSVTSTSKNPDIPTLAFYTINGADLNLQGTFRVEMARWDDYGTYLGNEPDNNNDFSKVSTVKFKLGCELPDEDFTKPYIVVLKKANTQMRNYERMRNPPVYYTGPAGYPDRLTIEDFNNDNYVAVKIANLK